MIAKGLLKEIEEDISEALKNDAILDLRVRNRGHWEDLLPIIIAKCHQSEAAEIDKLNMTLRTGEQQFIQQEVRIKELESKNKALHKAVQDVLEAQVEAMADERKKLGEWLENKPLYKTESGSLISNEDIAKLQKGEGVE
jgi:hypothetical protein